MVNQKSKLWTPAIRKYQNLIHLKNINCIFYDIFAKKKEYSPSLLSQLGPNIMRVSLHRNSVSFSTWQSPFWKRCPLGSQRRKFLTLRFRLGIVAVKYESCLEGEFIPQIRTTAHLMGKVMKRWKGTHSHMFSRSDQIRMTAYLIETSSW